MAKRFLVVGELNADMIVSGLSDLPTVGREVIADDVRIVLGGSSGICAAGLARLGATVDFAGKVGTGYFGDLLVKRFEDLGVGVDHVIRDRQASTGLTVSLSLPHDRALVTYLGCIPDLRLEDIDLNTLKRYCHLHVGSYFLQTELRPGLAKLFREARRNGLTISLDPGHDPSEEWGGSDLLELLERVDLFLPNEEEACAIAGASDAEEALCGLARRARVVVVKCGSEGAITLEDDRVIRVPGFRLRTVDTTGAGDSFDAGLIFAHLGLGEPLRDAMCFANACGALSTTGHGGTAAQATAQEARSFLSEHRESQECSGQGV